MVMCNYLNQFTFRGGFEILEPDPRWSGLDISGTCQSHSKLALEPVGLIKNVQNWVKLVKNMNGLMQVLPHSPALILPGAYLTRFACLALY